MTDHPATSGPEQRPPLPHTRPATPPQYAYPEPPRRSGGIFSKIATSLAATLLITSLILNAYLGAIVYSLYAGPTETPYASGDPEQRIVILPIDGAINDTTASSLRESLKSLSANPPKAVVLRITSPGGGITASDQIWNRITQFKTKHPDVPIVASFGSVAASGGYYVAAPADFIMAETTSITGSIGVIATGFTIEGMLNKIGVTPEVIVSTDSTNKDTGSMYRPWTDHDRQVIRGLLDSGYKRFVDVVAQGRAGVLTEEEVRSVATGEIFMAQEALDAKLIDGIGYLDDAIDKAIELAGIPADTKPTVTIIRKKETFNPLGIISSSTPDLNTLLTTQRLRDMATELAMPEISYRAPIALPSE
ncbi:MAG: signal peptide peptidase SppA [Phycisphaeraceae bacterium]